ncbi:hypothetical protein KFK09_015118 [Dendrobium nobile]|uniref:Uncharacterized protein n=1 Tax=Dendrobium nobile TaxID=94219 RepID=A0A8T3B5T8_DENNO|nr:hypothetical protein KFK09_015118 [Dendrobium nobile]
MQISPRLRYHLSNHFIYEIIGQDFWCSYAPCNGCENYYTKVDGYFNSMNGSGAQQ